MLQVLFKSLSPFSFEISTILAATEFGSIAGLVAGDIVVAPSFLRRPQAFLLECLKSKSGNYFYPFFLSGFNQSALHTVGSRCLRNSS